MTDLAASDVRHDRRRAWRRKTVLVVGDSVIRRAEDRLRRLVRHRLLFDAAINRQVVRTTTSPDGMAEVPSAIDVARDAGTHQTIDLAIFHLGHNGQIVDEGLERLMAAVPHSVVCFVTLKEPRHWERPNNDVLVRGVARHDRAHLLDWKALSDGRPYFEPDGLHLNEAGYIALANLVVDACDRHLGRGPFWGSRGHVLDDARRLRRRSWLGLRRRLGRLRRRLLPR